jgi:hypothetical protein
MIELDFAPNVLHDLLRVVVGSRYCNVDRPVGGVGDRTDRSSV